MTTLARRGFAPIREQLGNGAVVLAQQTAMAPVVTITASFVAAGAIHEPLGRPGLAYLAAKMLDRGTTRQSAEAIAETLDDRGVAIKLTASRHALIATATCLSQDFDVVLGILADVTRRPSFPEEQLHRRRAEVMTGLRQDEDNPFFRAADTLVALLYGADHPYGRPAKGSPASLERIGRDELAAFHARYVQPGALSLAVVGDVPVERALAQAAREFESWEGWPAEPAVIPAPGVPAGRRQVHVEMPGKAQSDIAYGFTAVRRFDPRFYAYWMMNVILGEFGLGGRLASNIRERQGMAYYAFSSFDPAPGEAPLLIRAGVDPINVARAIEAIDSEVRMLAEGGPTTEEFDETRQFLIGSIPRFFETNQGIVSFLLSSEQFGLGLDYADRLPELIGSVTLEQVADAAREVLRTDAASIVVAGPAEAQR